MLEDEDEEGPVAVGQALRHVSTWLTRAWCVDQAGSGFNRQMATLAHRKREEGVHYADWWADLIGKTSTQRIGVPGDAAIVEGTAKRAWYGSNAGHAAHAVLYELEKRENPEGIGPREEFSLEHVMPQARSTAWDAEIGPNADEVYAHHINRGGNIVLLETRKNSAAGKLPFEDKQAEYAKSRALRTRRLADIEAWTKETMEEQASDLGNAIVAQWPWEGRTTDETGTDIRWRLDQEPEREEQELGHAATGRRRRAVGSGRGQRRVPGRARQGAAPAQGRRTARDKGRGKNEAGTRTPEVRAGRKRLQGDERTASPGVRGSLRIQSGDNGRQSRSGTVRTALGGRTGCQRRVAGREEPVERSRRVPPTHPRVREAQRPRGGESEPRRVDMVLRTTGQAGPTRGDTAHETCVARDATEHGGHAAGRTGPESEGGNRPASGEGAYAGRGHGMATGGTGNVGQNGDVDCRRDGTAGEIDGVAGR